MQEDQKELWFNCIKLADENINRLETDIEYSINCARMHKSNLVLLRKQLILQHRAKEHACKEYSKFNKKTQKSKKEQ